MRLRELLRESVDGNALRIVKSAVRSAEECSISLSISTRPELLELPAHLSAHFSRLTIWSYIHMSSSLVVLTTGEGGSQRYPWKVSSCRRISNCPAWSAHDYTNS